MCIMSFSTYDSVSFENICIFFLVLLLASHVLLVLVKNTTSGCLRCYFYDAVSIHVMIQYMYMMPSYECTNPQY